MARRKGGKGRERKGTGRKKKEKGKKRKAGPPPIHIYGYANCKTRNGLKAVKAKFIEQSRTVYCRNVT